MRSTTSNPNRYFGPSVLDRTHQISFGGYADLPAGFQVSMISHFWSPLAVSVVVPNTNLGPGEIFRTDFTGDGTVQDPMPGTTVGNFDRGINALKHQRRHYQLQQHLRRSTNARGPGPDSERPVHLAATAADWGGKPRPVLRRWRRSQLFRLPRPDRSILPGCARSI